MDRSAELKAIADRILYGFNLFDYLHTIGKSHIIGSYKMNMMAIPDLDIAVENDQMSLERLYKTTNYLLDNIKPTSYKASVKTNKSGQKEWFFSFKKEIKNVEMNVDISFLSKAKIEAIEGFCGELVKRADFSKVNAIYQIKQTLFEAGVYNENQYTALDVYDAVFNKGITTYSEFVNKYKK